MDNSNQGDQGGGTDAPAGGTYTPPVSTPTDQPVPVPSPAAPLGDQPTSDVGGGEEQGGGDTTGGETPAGGTPAM